MTSLCSDGGSCAAGMEGSDGQPLTSRCSRREKAFTTGTSCLSIFTQPDKFNTFTCCMYQRCEREGVRDGRGEKEIFFLGVCCITYLDISWQHAESFARHTAALGKIEVV